MKNERAILMTLTFLIGFLSGYIAFGVPNQSADVLETQRVQAPTNEQKQTSNLTQATDRRIATDVVVEDGSLYAIIDGKKIIVSADNKHGEGPGFHESVESYELSADGTQLIYCITKNRSNDECATYTYDVASHVAYKR